MYVVCCLSLFVVCHLSLFVICRCLLAVIVCRFSLLVVRLRLLFVACYCLSFVVVCPLLLFVGFIVCCWSLFVVCWWSFVVVGASASSCVARADPYFFTSFWAQGCQPPKVSATVARKPGPASGNSLGPHLVSSCGRGLLASVGVVEIGKKVIFNKHNLHLWPSACIACEEWIWRQMFHLKAFGSRVAEVTLRREGPMPKRLDFDENFKP